MAEQPLKGKTVVITRSSEGSEEWTRELTEIGASVYHFPTIAMQPVPLSPALEQQFSDIAHFDWLVFTSATGAKYFKDIADYLDLDLRGRVVPPAACIGEKTAEAVREIGMRVGFVPSKEDSETFARELAPVEHKRLMLLRTTIASDDLPQRFQKMGASEVRDIKIYTTEPRTDTDPTFSKMLSDGKVSCITFASPSAVEGFTKRLTSDEFARAKTLPMVAISPAVAKVLTDSGCTRVFSAERPNLAGIILTLLKHVK